MNSKVYLTFLHSSNCEVNISVYAVNSGHGLVIVDGKDIAFFAQIYPFYPIFGRKSVGFRPNLHFLPRIWAKIVCYIKIIVYLCTKILSIWKD